MKWLSSGDYDWKAAIEEYQRKLDSGELEFDAKGDVIPDEKESPGWVAWLMTKLPPDNFGHGDLP